MSRPNFLIFCTDQLQSYCVGCHARRDVRTPNLDALAASGTSFTRTYCANPMCSPSRASLITGLTPRQHGCLTNGTPLPEQAPTITAALAAAGYRTHSVGKLHLQPWMGYGPHRSDPNLPFSWEDQVRWDQGEITRLPSPYYGFQSADFVGGHVDYVHGDYANWLRRQGPDARELLRLERAESAVPGRNDTWRLPIPEELHYNNWIADRTIDFLSAQPADQPFFLWCSFPDPHFPFAACPPYSRMYDPASMALPPTWAAQDDPLEFLAQRRAGFAGADFDEPALREMLAQTYGMITHVDAQVGRVLAALDRTGRAGSTVVAFTSDHGEYLGAHHLLYKSVWPYEELYRVPMVWRAPGGGGRLVNDPVSGLDLAPTVAELAGIPLAAFDRRGYGQSQRPVLAGRSLAACIAGGALPPDRPVLIEMDEDGLPGPMLRMRTIVRGQYKLTLYSHLEPGLLFDLGDDPGETVNRWADPACRDVRADLLAEMVRELARTDRLDVPRIAGA